VSLLPLIYSLVNASSDDSALKELETAIRQELPLGSSRESVVGFLRRRAVPYHDSKDINYYQGPRTVWGMLTRSANNQMSAMDTILTFEFDTQDRLVSYSAKTRLVGP